MRLNVRVCVIGALVLVLAMVMGVRLYTMQIVNGSDYAIASEKKIVRTVTIPAARGGIFDRYGRPLVTNELSYDVYLDLKRLRLQDDPSVALLELVRLVEQTGNAYVDEFPVTQVPFSYKTTATSAQKDRLEKYLERKEWKGVTAAELIDRLRVQFKLPDRLGDHDARLAVGVLYELELREIVPTVAPYVFARNVSMELVSNILERAIPAARVENVPIRQYDTDFAAHLLGRVGQIPEEQFEQFASLGYASDEIVGIDGAERAFESWLHGEAGVRTEETNTAGRVQNVVYTKEPKPGANVYLTVDIALQAEVERLLESHILKMQETGEPLKGKESEAGAAVVVDVRTGEVLAMASYPTFHLQSFSQDYAGLLEDPLKPLYNRAIAGVYSPGSTYKMVTATAGLEDGLITPESKITDRGVYTYYKDYQPKCHIYPSNHGTINVMQALQKSCNYFFFDVGRQEGIERQGFWARQYGLGEATGIELQGEQMGYVAGPETSKQIGSQWYPGLALAAAIGQSDNAFTPLQIANYVATIAGDGKRHAAHLLSEVKEYDFSQTLYETPVTVVNDLSLSDATISALQTGMHMVAQSGGTAYSTFVGYPVEIAAKTGSVQSTQDKPNNAVFVAYGPYETPEIAVTVVVEKGGAGSRIAPIAKDVLDAYFRIQQEMRDVPGENTLLR